jgi:hypothetical protein
MARAMKIVVEVEDVGGSVARLLDLAPKKVRQFLSTAVFQTAAAVQRGMEATAPVGPDDQGRTPGLHIAQDIEHRGRHGSLHAQVGVFDDPDQVAVATYNEYRPNRQPFMRISAQAQSGPFEERARQALGYCERFFTRGF